MLDLLISSLIFIPGILLMLVFLRRRQIGFLDSVLFGSVLWNYLFISSSVLLGLTSHSIVAFFNIFGILSICLLVISSVVLMKRLIRSSIIFKVNFSNIPYLVILSFLSIFFITLMYFHTFFTEWDVISYYIPAAKGILSSQGLTSQQFVSLNFFDVSPATPISYAFVLNFLDITSLYALPIIYFALTLLTIFLIAKKLFPTGGAIVPVLIFMSIPTVLIMISSRSLYLDLPFTFFLISSLYFAVSICKSDLNRVKYDWPFFSMSIILACFTRIELGIFLLPLAIGLIFFNFRVKYWIPLSVLVIGTIFYVREMRNFFIDASSWAFYLQRLFPVIIFSALALLVLTIMRLEQKREVNSPGKKSAVTTLIFTLPFVVYMLRSIFVDGFIVPILPTSNLSLLNSAHFFYNISVSTAGSWTSQFQWGNFISVWWLATPFLIPIGISLAVSMYRLSKRLVFQPYYVPILLFFVCLFMIWSTALLCDSQPRHVYYFTPFIALLVGHGLLTIRGSFNPKGFSLRVCAYASLIVVFALLKMNVQNLNDIAVYYSNLYSSLFDLQFTATCALTFFAIFCPYETIFKNTKHFVLRLKPTIIRHRFISVIVIGLNFILLASLCGPIILDAAGNGYQNRSQYLGGWYYYPEVTDYYNQNIKDSGVTVGFFCHDLITFANRTIIDLNNPIYGLPLYSIIDDLNKTSLLAKFEQLNVKYLLIPLKGTTFYPLYENLANNSAFGEIFENNAKLYPLQTFKYATLYRFYSNFTLDPLPYSNAKPWNYDSSKNYTFSFPDKSEFQFEGFSQSNGLLAVMLTSNETLTLPDILQFSVESEKQVTFTFRAFSDINNRTTNYMYTEKPLSGRGNLLVYINQGSKVGNFSSNHIEGILIGIKTDSNTFSKFTLTGAFSVNLQ